MSASIQSARQVYQALRPLIDDVRALVAGVLAQSASSAQLAALEYAFVYRPGGVPGGTVYTSWPTLMAAMAKVQGPKVLSVDDSIVTPALVPPGAWNLNEVTLLQSRNGATLQFEDGATLTGTRILSADGLSLVHDNATTPVWTWDASAPLLVLLDGAGVFASGGGVSTFIDNPAGLGTNGAITVDGGNFGDGTNPSITTGLGTTTDVTVQDGGAFAPSAATGAGAYVFVNTSDGAIGAQPGAGTRFYFLPPDTIAETNANAIGPAAPLTFTSAGTITRKKSGLVRVAGAMKVTGAAGTVTFNVLRDGMTVLASQTVAADAGGNAQASVPWIDTLPDLAAHTYSIQAVNGATVLSAAGKGAIITADELS